MRIQDHRLAVSGVATALVIFAGCSSSPASNENSPDTGFPGGNGGNAGTSGGAAGIGGSGGGSVTSGGNANGGGSGIGTSCVDSSTCKSGLTCGSMGICEPAHPSTIGQPCILDDECQATSYCSITHLCAARASSSSTGGASAAGGSTAAAGSAGVAGGAGGSVVAKGSGATCASDGDCTAGQRCVLAGFSASCAPEGMSNVGEHCAETTDCLGGLICAGNVCAQSPVGLPAFGFSSWPGEDCVPDATTPTAYFHVPRGTNDGDFYRLPFPNDIRTSNGHPSYTGHPTPGASLLGYDIVQRYLDAISADDDGFGAYPTVYFRFSTDFDLTSLRAAGAVSFIDITPMAPELGEGRSLSWDAYSGASKYICKNLVGVRPAMGEPLTSGHTYAVIIATGVASSNSGPFQTDADLQAILASSAPTDSALAAAYAAYAPFRAYLSMKAMAPSSILSAAVFTVGHVQALGQALATAVEAAAPPAASGWMACGAGTDPCPDTTGTRACGATDPDFTELHALVSLPIFQQGTEPYLTPSDGGDVKLSGGALTPNRTEQVCLSLTVPKVAAAPSGGWPVVVYAHGTGGSFRDQINNGIAKSLATASTPMATIGIDQVEHGPRRGGSSMSPDDLFYNFANPAASLGNPLQGAADQVSLGRFAATFSLSATASPTGSAIAIDPSAVMFWGHSQGATEGGISVPYSKEYVGAVLSGEGASLIDGLLGKTLPVNIARVLPYVLQDPDPSDPTKLLLAQYNPVMSILQSYIDPADPLNSASLMALTPPSGLKGHHVFQPFGMADSYAPTTTEATYALAAQLGLAGALLSTTPDDSPVDCAPGGPMNNCTLMGGPVSLSGNLQSADGQTMLTAAVRQYASDGTYDGHFVSTNNPDAKADVVAFLAGMAAHETPVVGH